MSTKIILASQSPRRRALMESIAPGFTVEVSGTEESLAPGTPPGEAVEQLALRKARAVAARQDGPSGWVVIGADTVVALEGEIMGKPSGPEDAGRMLRRLSGRVHQVFTGTAVLWEGGRDCFTTASQVEFYPLSDGEIEGYIASEEPFGKAGAYAIQLGGKLFVKEIHGDYTNIVGLPVARLCRRMTAHGLISPPFWEKL